MPASRRLALDPAIERFRGVADFALAGEENEDVPGRFLRELVDGVAHGIQRVAVLFKLVVRAGIVRSGFVRPAGWDSGRYRISTG